MKSVLLIAILLVSTTAFAKHQIYCRYDDGSRKNHFLVTIGEPYRNSPIDMKEFKASVVGYDNTFPGLAAGIFKHATVIVYASGQTHIASMYEDGRGYMAVFVARITPQYEGVVQVGNASSKAEWSRATHSNITCESILSTTP